jgi:hypothetical protein
MNTLKSMNTRQFRILGLAVLGLAFAAPVQADGETFLDGVLIAARDGSDTRAREEPRARGAEDYRDGRDRRANQRDAERDEPRGYGYGYERRQQRGSEYDGRSRGRN